MRSAMRSRCRRSSASGGSASRRMHSNSVRLLRVHMAAVRSSHTSILSEVQVHAAIIPLSSEEEESEGSTEHEEDVEDAKEDDITRHTDDVTTIRDGKGDGVEEPPEVDVGGEHCMVTTNLDTIGGGTTTPQGLEGEEEVGNGAEGVESPLVASSCEGRAEVGDDPAFVRPSTSIKVKLGGGPATYHTHERKTLKKMVAQLTPLTSPRAMMMTGKATTQKMYLAKKT